MLPKLLGFLLISSFVSSLAQAAELTFEQTLMKVMAKPDASTVYVEFAFTNKSDKPIKIVSYNAPCTCMEARMRRGDKKQSLIFAPGETGVVIGVLDFENFKGTIDKVIEITTDQDSTISLTARVTIPILIGPDVSSITWNVGDALTPKSFTIKVASEKPIKIIRQEMGFGADEYFAYKFETVKEGFEYKVTVTPKKTSEPSMGALRFATDSKINRFKNVQVFLSISPKKK